MEQAYTFVEYNAVYGEIFAAAACLWIGARLYRLASRTGAAPERLLSAAFLYLGLAYLLYDLPYLMLDEGSNLLGVFFFASRIYFLAVAIFIAVLIAAIYLFYL